MCSHHKKARLGNVRIIGLTFDGNKVMVFKSINKEITMRFTKGSKYQNKVEEFKSLINRVRVEYQNYIESELVIRGGVDQDAILRESSGKFPQANLPSDGEEVELKDLTIGSDESEENNLRLTMTTLEV